MTQTVSDAKFRIGVNGAGAGMARTVLSCFPIFEMNLVLPVILGRKSIILDLRYKKNLGLFCVIERGKKI